MSNYHLKDTALSLKAKGLLSMFLSFPEDWNYSTRGLASICKEGVDAIGATLKELEKAGYIVRRQLRGANGRITDTEYTIFEKPQPPEPPEDVLSTPMRFCSFSPKRECRKMAGKGVQPLNNYTCRFRPSSLKCTDKSGLDGLQADK